MPGFVEILVVVQEFLSAGFYLASILGIGHLYFHRKWEQEVNLMNRLTKAETALANGNESARISAVQEAIQVARESERLSRKKSLRIRNRVAEDICSHVRKTTGEGKYQSEHKEWPSDEIQTMLTQAFVQNGDVFEGCEINLRDSYLRRINLSHARLRNADFMFAQLQYAQLGHAQLRDANFWSTQLQGAEMFLTRLQGANLRDAKLQKADIKATQMQGAIVSESIFQGAKLSNVGLQGADLSHTDFQGAELDHVLMQGCYSFQYPIQIVRFAMDIKERIGEHAHLDGITFSGGLKEEDVDDLCNGLMPEDEQDLRDKLASHIDVEASHSIPFDSDVATDSYTKKDAKRWIAEYNKGIPIRQKVKRSLVSWWYDTIHPRITNMFGKKSA